MNIGVKSIVSASGFGDVFKVFNRHYDAISIGFPFASTTAIEKLSYIPEIERQMLMRWVIYQYMPVIFQFLEYPMSQERGSTGQTLRAFGPAGIGRSLAQKNCYHPRSSQPDWHTGRREGSASLRFSVQARVAPPNV
jgi:hypothetical protein